MDTFEKVMIFFFAIAGGVGAIVMVIIALIHILFTG